MTVSSLEAAGLETMGDAAIDAFLDSERVGVLGLPTGGAPYMVPISYGYDGDDVYFTFVGGEDSRKRTLVEQTDTAGFLVFDVRSMYNWESVALTGTPEVVPEDKVTTLADVLAGAWRPEVFETAVASDAIVVYRLRIDERSGIKHTGLPPGFDE